MDITINRKHSVKEAGDLILTKQNNLYALIYDQGERYPYHLICFNTFTVVQSYDTLPTNKDIEEDVDDTLIGIYEHENSHITLN